MAAAHTFGNVKQLIRERNQKQRKITVGLQVAKENQHCHEPGTLLFRKLQMGGEREYKTHHQPKPQQNNNKQPMQNKQINQNNLSPELA